jgi:hypothetical protein
VQSGQWTIYLAVNTDGRFPDFSRCIPKAEDAKARCQFSVADAAFLAETLPRLPSHDDGNRPVTLDLNGQIVVRAKPSDSDQPTELVLTGSSFSGEPVRVNINRTYLARALRLGIRELSFVDDKTAILGFDDTRQYVFMPLDPESAIPPAEDAIRIESPVSSAAVPPSANLKPERKLQPVSEPIHTTNTNGNGSTNGHAANGSGANGHVKTNGHVRNGAARKTGQDIDGLIRQAEALRTAQREHLTKTGELLKALKRHRRQSRALQTTIASLRQLKTLGV